MKEKNATFRGAEPSWANACVGNNGNPSYVEYSQGFSKAANVLIDEVINDDGIHLTVDEFIYPVCFNMRHSVELRLKGSIEQLISLAKIKNTSLAFNNSSSHDIGIIWSFFKEHSEALDKRYIEVNQSIEPTILDIAEVDPTGQTFRYAISNDSQKHLTDVAVINFFVLKKKFNTLEENLKTLHSLNQWLINEYNQGTFTNKLSRPDIFKIAQSLPPLSKWREPDFIEVRESIKTEYSLSNRDFSKAVDLIKSHYNLCPMISEPLPLLGISVEGLKAFINEWVKASPESLGDHGQSDENDDTHDTVSSYSSLASKYSIEDIIRQAEARRIALENLEQFINPEFVAGIQSLFYFARDKGFSEYYKHSFECNLRATTASLKISTKDLNRDFIHIFFKSNALSNILLSLFALGHYQLAEEHIKAHDLEKVFRWLKNARSGDLFTYPDIAKY